MVASKGPPVYLAVRLAMATAVIVVASPHMTHALRFVGRGVIVAGALAGIALGVTLPIGVVTGFIVGIGSAAIVHLLVGSPAGRLTLDQVGAALDEIGVEANGLRQAPLEPRGVALATATASDGRSLLVKIYGRDAWDGQLLASTWSALWHRGESPHLGASRLQLVEHEAFLTLMAERGGVQVMPVVAAGTAAEGDALLVSETTARSFDSLDPAEIDDGLLRDRLGHGRAAAWIGPGPRADRWAAAEGPVRWVAGAHRLRQGHDRGHPAGAHDGPRPGPGHDRPRRGTGPGDRRRARLPRR